MGLSHISILGAESYQHERNPALSTCLSLEVMSWIRDRVRARAYASFAAQPPTGAYRGVRTQLTAVKVSDHASRAMRGALLQFAPVLEYCLLREYPYAMHGIFPKKESTVLYEALIIELTEMVFGYNGVDRPIVKAFLELYRKHATQRSSERTH